MSLQFTDLGHGKPVVLIHGYPLDRTIWREQEVLAEGCRLILPDLPGFGSSPSQGLTSLESYADAIVGILDTLGISRAAVIGHSMGGYITLAMLEKYANRLNGVGLINSQAGADSNEARTARFSLIKRVEQEGTGFVAGMMAEKLFAADVSVELQTQVMAIMMKASVNGVIAALRSMADRRDRTDLLSKLSMPLLVIAGKEDRLIPLERTEAIKAACSKAHYYLLDRTGHMAMLERPAQVNDALREFVAAL